MCTGFTRYERRTLKLRFDSTTASMLRPLTPFGPKTQIRSLEALRNVRQVGVTLLLPFIEVIDSLQR
jgi:hypothetical protein